MRTHVMKLNDGELVPLHTIRRVSIATEKDIYSLQKLNDQMDFTKFNCKVDISKKGEFYATQTVADFKKQGINFVQVSDRSYVPTDNIISARDLNTKDRESFHKNTTRALPDSFKSKLDTTAGTVLADVSAREVLGRMTKPFIPPEQLPLKMPNRPKGKDNGAGL